MSESVNLSGLKKRKESGVKEGQAKCFGTVHCVNPGILVLKHITH